MVALSICYFAPDPRTRLDAAKLFGVGICVAYYVSNVGYHKLMCRMHVCDMPLEVLVVVIFILLNSPVVGVACAFPWRPGHAVEDLGRHPSAVVAPQLERLDSMNLERISK